MDVVDPVSKFIVLLLQHFLLPSGTEEQQDHIDDKEDQQHDFQADTDEIFIPDHALGDIFWKSLQKDKVMAGQIGNAEIVGQTVGITKISSLAAVCKDLPGAGRRLFIDHIGFQQNIDQIAFISFLVVIGAGDHRAVRRTEKKTCPLAEVGGI